MSSLIGLSKKLFQYFAHGYLNRRAFFNKKNQSNDVIHEDMFFSVPEVNY